MLNGYFTGLCYMMICSFMWQQTRNNCVTLKLLLVELNSPKTNFEFVECNYVNSVKKDSMALYFIKESAST